MKTLSRIIAVLPIIAASAALGQQPTVYVEALPDRVQARLEVINRAAANAPRSATVRPQYFIFVTKRWSQPLVRVAFLGGSDDLRRKIAATASEWQKYGSVRFDFIDSATGRYREWSRGDNSFRADIRIGFDGLEGHGYWSMLGVDSVDPRIVGPGEASMQLEGLDRSLPNDWQATVRHEFGHALGLEHEHQIPVGGCDPDFRWNDDPGYQPTQNQYGSYISDSNGRRPGIYTMLAGAPNYWPKEKADYNMRQLIADSHNYDFGSFDKDSIMKYYFDESLFGEGKKSHCYSEENLIISPEDQRGVAKWYPPHDSEELKNVLQMQDSIMNQLKSVVHVQDVQNVMSPRSPQ